MLLESGKTVTTARATGVADRAWAGRAFQLLRLVFTLVPIVAGVDKFFNMIANWGQYLAPQIDAIIPGTAHEHMMAAGIIEIAAGVLVGVWPFIGGYVVAGWLLGIVVNLLLLGDFYDIALRDFVLAMGALALAWLAADRRRAARTRS
jgi:hypothetical protein